MTPMDDPITDTPRSASEPTAGLGPSDLHVSKMSMRQLLDIERAKHGEPVGLGDSFDARMLLRERMVAALPTALDIARGSEP